MALANSILIRIDRPEDTPFGKLLNEIRTWLDSNKIQPVDFRPAVGEGIGFEICFGSKADAELFTRQFT